MVKGVGAGVVLDAKPDDGQRRYPLINEIILHHCGINVAPMDDGACMLRFPSSNGLVVTVPLSSEGLDDLIAQIEAARTSEPVDAPDTVSE